MKILCVGEVHHCVEMRLDNFLKKGDQIEVKKTFEHGDGYMYRLASILGTWKLDVSFLGYVGNDSYGLSIKHELESANVNTDYLLINEKMKTPIELVLKNDEDTTIIYNLNDKTKEKIEENIMPDIILVDSKEYDLSLYLINKYQSSISILKLDCINEKTIKLASKVDIVIYDNKLINNKVNDLENTYLKLKESFKNVILPLDNGILYEYNNEIKLLPLLEDIKYDSFNQLVWNSAFIYAIFNKFEYEDCILFSNVALSLVHDEKLPSLDMIKEKYLEYK